MSNLTYYNIFVLMNLNKKPPKGGFNIVPLSGKETNFFTEDIVLIDKFFLER